MLKKIESQIKSERLFRDLDKPSLHTLSYALRHPDTWPEGFVWKYSSCRQCAMGLAHQLWQNKIPQSYLEDGASVMARSFAMPFEVAETIFLNCSWPYRLAGLLIFPGVGRGYGSVSPEMVADEIDRYLATAE